MLGFVGFVRSNLLLKTCYPLGFFSKVIPLNNGNITAIRFYDASFLDFAGVTVPVELHVSKY